MRTIGADGCTFTALSGRLLILSLCGGAFQPSVAVWNARDQDLSRHAEKRWYCGIALQGTRLSSPVEERVYLLRRALQRLPTVWTLFPPLSPALSTRSFLLFAFRRSQFLFLFCFLFPSSVSSGVLYRIPVLVYPSPFSYRLQ